MWIDVATAAPVWTSAGAEESVREGLGAGVRVCGVVAWTGLNTGPEEGWAGPSPGTRVGVGAKAGVGVAEAGVGGLVSAHVWVMVGHPGSGVPSVGWDWAIACIGEGRRAV